jgi:hypothetical protein
VLVARGSRDLAGWEKEIREKKEERQGDGTRGMREKNGAGGEGRERSIESRRGAMI